MQKLSISQPAKPKHIDTYTEEPGDTKNPNQSKALSETFKNTNKNSEKGANVVIGIPQKKKSEFTEIKKRVSQHIYYTIRIILIWIVNPILKCKEIWILYLNREIYISLNI